jgi:hypothetical protein
VIGAAPAVGRRVRIVGASRSAAYGDDDGFVVVLTLLPPVLPNGAQVGRLPAVGEEVVVRAHEVWDPTLRLIDPPTVEVADDELVRDPSGTGARLIGRGPGLTPEGDDFVAGLAAVVAVGSWASREAWLAALIGRDLRRRTTSLSATLLELAARGMGPRPLQEWLAGDAAARERLELLGHSTGGAIARGVTVGLHLVGGSVTLR